VSLGVVHKGRERRLVGWLDGKEEGLFRSTRQGNDGMGILSQGLGFVCGVVHV